MKICNEEPDPKQTMLSDLEPGDVFEFRRSAEVHSSAKNSLLMVIGTPLGGLYYVRVDDGSFHLAGDDQPVVPVDGCFVIGGDS